MAVAPLCSQEGSLRGSLACGDENPRPCSRDDARSEPNSLRSFFLSLLQLVALSCWCVKSAIGIRAAEEV
jgi:hypothetical protein